MNANTETNEKNKTKKRTANKYSLILYNDDVNTFDHVINCLIRICQHDIIQAEQCAWLVHNKGKCAIKSGRLSNLKKMLNSLTESGLSAQIE
jgi:ATP-dependent Clp protease adaptor protein ClpS